MASLKVIFKKFPKISDKLIKRGIGNGSRGPSEPYVPTVVSLPMLPTLTSTNLLGKDQISDLVLCTVGYLVGCPVGIRPNIRLSTRPGRISGQFKFRSIFNFINFSSHRTTFRSRNFTKV